MSTADSSEYDASNDTTSKLFVAGAFGLGVLLLLFRLPFWFSYLVSDRAGSGLRLAGHSDPRRKFEADYAKQPPPIRHVSPVIAHGRWIALFSPYFVLFSKANRTFYNSFLLPSVVCGLTIGQCVLMALWIALPVAAFLYDKSFTNNPKRGAYVALSQLPFVIVLSGKHSPVGLLGKSYVQVNFMHRLAGRTLFAAAALHAVFYVFIDPFKSSGTATMRIFGYGAIGSLTLIVLTSLRPVRKYLYQTFAICHWLGIVGFFVCAVLHTPQAKLWVFVAAGILGFDIFLRVGNTRVRTTRITTEGGNFSRLRVEGVEHGWRAGQHVRIRVKKGMLGFESHPFTIANCPSTGFMGRPRGLILHVHATGDWSRKLRTLAYSNSGLDDFSILGGLGLKPMIVQVATEGPYGSPLRDLTNSESALIVVGGSGITYGLALLEDAVGRAFQDRCRTENLVFAWTCRDHEIVSTFSDELNRIANLADETPGLSVHFRIHLTDKDAPSTFKDIRGAVVSHDRLQCNEVVKLVVKQTLGEKGKRGLCKGGIHVAGCGPQSLMDALRRACSCIDYSDAVQTGGLVVSTESFSL